MSDPLEEIRLAIAGVGEHHAALAANIGAAWHERAALLERIEQFERHVETVIEPELLARAEETQARLVAAEKALARAVVYVKNMEMPDTGVIGPGGEREHDYHRAILADEIREWEALIAALEARVDS